MVTQQVTVDDGVTEYVDSQRATVVEGYVSSLVPRLSPRPDKI